MCSLFGPVNLRCYIRALHVKKLVQLELSANQGYLRRLSYFTGNLGIVT